MLTNSLSKICPYSKIFIRSFCEGNSSSKKPPKFPNGRRSNFTKQKYVQAIKNVKNHRGGSRNKHRSGPKKSTDNLAILNSSKPPFLKEVLALPTPNRPLFPGQNAMISVAEPETIRAILKNLHYKPKSQSNFGLKGAKFEGETKHNPKDLYVGVFFQKTKNIESTSGDNKFTGGLTFSDLHQIGTFCSVSTVFVSNKINKSTDLPDSLTIYVTGIRRVEINNENNEIVDSTNGLKNPLVSTPVIHEDHFTLDKAEEGIYPDDAESEKLMVSALVNETILLIRQIAYTNPILKEQISYIQSALNRLDLSDPGRIADAATSLVGNFSNSDSNIELQNILNEKNVAKRLELVLVLLKKELTLSEIQTKIGKEVEEKVSADHKKFLLNEQLKVIKKQLGIEKDDREAVVEKLRRNLRVNKEDESSPLKTIPKEAKELIEDEFNKLNYLEKNSSEFNITRTYLDWLTQLPWGVHSTENFDLNRATRILDEDHYGLKDVKDRILEFIAVGNLQKRLKGDQHFEGKILCLVGPPGVGKTSIGKSIARAVNREFFRFSVGGLYDVAEIKGHRKTYVGAMPGKIIQALKKVQSENPLILIDEIDKLAGGGGATRSGAGDPSSALLEVLDPNQNDSFTDHYLDTPYDLRKCLFVCTANSLDTIPTPLLDRMEVIKISGYDLQEKLSITKDYLIPKAIKECALFEASQIVKAAEDEAIQDENNSVNSEEPPEVTLVGDHTHKLKTLQHSHKVHIDPKTRFVSINDEAICELIRWYCRESGVRNLEKHIGKIMRKVAYNIVTKEEKQPTDKSQNNDAKKKSKKVNVTAKNLPDYVGKPVFLSDRLYDSNITTPPGVVMGLAWTALGGTALYIESVALPTAIKNKPDGEKSSGGRGGSVEVTGQLGKVMTESSKISHTVAKVILSQKRPENSFFNDFNVHLHAPEGATPKDGPSAGVTMALALLSLATKTPVPSNVALTGELSLTGLVLPVGGIKEKVIAAKRSGITRIILPKQNSRDYDELADYIKKDLEVTFASEFTDVLKVALPELA